MALTNDQVTSAVSRYSRNNDWGGLQNYLTSNGATPAQSANAGAAYNAAVANAGKQKESLDYTTSQGIPSAIKATLKSEISKSAISELSSDDNIDVNAYVNSIAKKLAIGLKPTELLKEFGGDVLRQVQNEEQTRTDINEQLGITAKLSDNVLNTIIESTTNALRFGFGMKEVSSMFIAMSEITGRANFMSTETADKSFAVARSFVGSLSDVGKLLGEAEKIGLGASDTLMSVEKAGRSSLSLGLNTKKTTELLKNDLSKLNEYGFQNGIEGLNRMVQKSIEFRMNLGEVYKIADKVMNPDSAIELTANLQVLGGAIGDFNDPLKLMYMATNNVEGLQDALIGAASGLATYNQEQGKFEITGVNLRRAKEMAAQLGVEYKEFAKGAIAAQERLSVVQDLAGKGFNLNEKDTEFIANLSQMKDGKMVLSIPEEVSKKIGVATETAISDLTQNQIETLKNNQKLLENKSIEEIARDQFNVVKNIQNDVNSMANRTFRTLSPTVKDVAEKSEGQRLLQSIADKGARSAVMNSTNESELKKELDNVRKTVKDYATSLGINGLSESVLKGIESTIVGSKEDQERIKRKQEEDRKREEKTRPKKDLSYNPNTILKSKIDVTFPFGFGIPTAEQQGSYLVTV